MPWCPICKEEYKEGIETCPECNTKLVASLEEAEKSDFVDLIAFADEALARKFTEYLIYSDIEAKLKESKENKGEYNISVNKKDMAKAKKHFNAFYSVETSNALARNQEAYYGAKALNENETDDEMSWDRNGEGEDISTDVDEGDTAVNTSCNCKQSSGAYVSMSEKKSDLFSTLVVFTVFGIAGLIILALELLHVINFMNTMMLLMLIAIVCVGVPAVLITTYLSYKKTLVLAQEEEKLTASLNEWMVSVFTKESVHRLLYSIRVNAPGIPEEQIYLLLNQAMKKRVCDQFGELDDSYLDYIVDTYYDTHFSEDSEDSEEL